MKDNSKLAFVLIGLMVIYYVFRIIYPTASFILYSLGNYLLSIVSAIWLFAEARKNNSNWLFWTIFGIVSGLIGVGIFYVYSLYYEKKSKI